MSTQIFNVQNLPIYSLPHLYISGMNLSVATTTVMAIAPGQCRDSNDNIDIAIGFPNLQGFIQPQLQFDNFSNGLYINCAVNGANGLDVGSLAASTQYSIYVIADSRGYLPVAGIMSLTSSPLPLFPLGYDSYRLLGFIETDSSNHFVYATHEPQSMSAALEYMVQPAVGVLSGGNATTFTAIDMSSGIPSAGLPNVIASLLVTFIPAAVGDVVQFRPTGSSATAPVTTIVGQVAGFAQTQYINIIAGVGSTKPEIDYLVTSSSDSVSVSVVAWTGAPHTAYPT